MAISLLARCRNGLLLPRQRATLDNIALVWHHALLKGVLALAVPPWLPRVLAQACEWQLAICLDAVSAILRAAVASA